MFTRTARNPRLDLLVGAASLWISWAFFIDAWSHENLPYETFFTWAHGLIYGGMVVLVAVLAIMRKEIPAAYRVPLIGVPIFLLGGMLDLGWHSLFGIEEGVDIILSPTHETIGLGLMLVSSAPLFSALRYRSEMRTLRDHLPMIFSLASWLVMVHFATAYATDPAAGIVNAPPDASAFSANYFTATAISYYKLVGGVVILLLQSFIMASFVLFIASRFETRPGALTLLLVLGNTLPALPFTDESPLLVSVFAMSALAGIVGDALIAWMGPFPRAAWRFRIYAAAVPATYIATYMVAIALTGGSWWDWSVRTSLVLFAGVIGLGLSLVMLPSDNVPA
ncbi:MAG: hypothetical protein KGN02_02130 [bacterium]|nr:hypothetical protein [bacterium]